MDKNLACKLIMGQQTSTPAKDDSNPAVEAELEKFNLQSKSGIGVHMFCFTPPRHLSAGGAEKIYLASEVTDNNDVLDVKYSEWKKKFVAPPREEASRLPFAQPESKLKAVWTPAHQFSSGRVAMVAVTALLNQGYKMKECKPENEL